MDPFTWDELQKAFHEVADLEPGEQRSRLDGRFGIDTPLRRELERMIEEDAGLDRCDRVVEAFLGNLATSSELAEGARIGDFRIVRRVATGGMGTVFEARQENPARRVAVKLLAVGLGSDDAVRRFRLEAEALARLGHPAIAQVFASGTQDDGLLAVPWFAMEFVEDAKALTEFARERELSVEERLQLFLRVCDAIQHAHAKGVIHRDLKPGNVLVDGEGNPKVIDFGIARLESQGSAQTLGRVAGTPAYMSPEQLEQPSTVDTRSDVWSLGALLFELLTGELPFGAESVEVASALRLLRDSSPRALSSVAPRLAGDLEWIVGKSLERDRERRYATVSDLAADLRRHLAHEPVLAAPPSAAYRISRFVRRHRLGVGAAAAVFLSLAGGAVAALVGLGKAREAEKRATTAGELAKDETKKVKAEWARAEATVDAFSSMLRSPKVLAAGAKVPFADALSIAFDRIVGNPRIAPADRYRLISALMQTFASLGDRAQFERASADFVAAGESAFGPDHVRTWTARIAHADAQVANGKRAEARALLVDAVARCRASLAEPAGEVLDVEALAGLAWRCDEREIALALLREVLDSGRLAGEPREAASLEITFAWLLARANRHEDAARRLERAEPLLAKLEPDDETHLRRNVVAADIRYGRGDQRGGIRDLRDARDRLEERFGFRNSGVLRATIDLAISLERRGDTAEALEESRRAFDAAKEVFAPEAPLSLDAADTLSVSLGRSGKHDEAIALKQSVLEGRERAYGRDHLRTIRSRKELAFLLISVKRFTDGEAIARAAFEDAERVLGPNRFDTASALFVVAQAVAGKGRWEESEPLFIDAARRMRESRAPGFESTAATIDAHRAGTLISLQRYDEAEAVLRDALTILRKTQGDDGRVSLYARENLVELYVRWGKPERAREEKALLEEARGAKSRPAR